MENEIARKWDMLAADLELAGDAAVDRIAAAALSSPDGEATPFLIRALSVATSESSKRASAAALAVTAAPGDSDAVESLEEAYRQARQNASLGPALLRLLGLLGLRCATARAATLSQIQRLKRTDTAFLLTAAAKVAGLLLGEAGDLGLRKKLDDLLGTDDVGVKAELHYQLSLVALADAFQAASHDELIAGLERARGGLSAAIDLEEMRPDAVLVRLLIDLVVQFEGIDTDRQLVNSTVKELAKRIRAEASGLGERVFREYRSDAAVSFTTRALNIAEALEAAVGEVAVADRWTNFDDSVVRLAECYRLIRSCPAGYLGMGKLIEGTGRIADRVLKPRLGPVLLRKVGRTSLAQVVKNYRALRGEDEILIGLIALQEAELEAERTPGARLSEEKHGKLAALAAKVQMSPDELVDEIVVVVHDGRASQWAVRVGLLPQSIIPEDKESGRMTLPTVGVITALPEEFDAVRLMLSNPTRKNTGSPGPSNEYILGEVDSLRGGKHFVVLAQTARMGNNSAAIRASKMLTDFPSVESIIMCGIAGGVPNPESPTDHVRLGDIVISNGQGVIQYDFGKQKLAEFDHRHAPRPPSWKLLQAVQVLDQDLLTGQRPWDAHFQRGLDERNLTRPAESTDCVLDKAGEVVPHPTVPGPTPRIFQGAVASGNCVQGDYRKRDKLRDKFKVKAVEMEGSGIADATWEYEKAGYLIVRGICDYCDARNKNTQTDAWKPLAAMAAAAYARALLEVIPGGSERPQ